MTPKEKAEELKIQFDMVIYTDQNHDEQVKRCAFKAAYNVYNALSNLHDNSSDNALFDKQVEFWESVIEELE